MSVMNTHSSGRFWPVSWTITHCFGGARAISTIDDPRGAFTCPSSTLKVLANSHPFHGLLLTVLVSRNDFHSCRTPRCAYVSVINTGSFGRFWAVSWTITHFLGVPKWFPWLTNHVVRLCVGHQHSQFWPILVCFVHYYSPF